MSWPALLSLSWGAVILLWLGFMVWGGYAEARRAWWRRVTHRRASVDRTQGVVRTLPGSRPSVVRGHHSARTCTNRSPGHPSGQPRRRDRQ